MLLILILTFERDYLPNSTTEEEEDGVSISDVTVKFLDEVKLNFRWAYFAHICV